MKCHNFTFPVILDACLNKKVLRIYIQIKESHSLLPAHLYTHILYLLLVMQLWNYSLKVLLLFHELALGWMGHRPLTQAHIWPGIAWCNFVVQPGSHVTTMRRTPTSTPLLARSISPALLFEFFFSFVTCNSYFLCYPLTVCLYVINI